MQNTVAYFSKRLGRTRWKQVENRIIIENYLTQTDIAQIICTSRQTATLLLNELEEKGLMYYGRKEIIIEDISKL